MSANRVQLPPALKCQSVLSELSKPLAFESFPEQGLEEIAKPAREIGVRVNDDVFSDFTLNQWIRDLETFIHALWFKFGLPTKDIEIYSETTGRRILCIEEIRDGEVLALQKKSAILNMIPVESFKDEVKADEEDTMQRTLSDLIGNSSGYYNPRMQMKNETYLGVPRIKKYKIVDETQIGRTRTLFNINLFSEMQIQHNQDRFDFISPYLHLIPQPVKQQQYECAIIKPYGLIDTPNFSDYITWPLLFAKRDSLIQRCKAMSIERGFQLNTFIRKSGGTNKIQFTCYKGMKGFFHKTALEDQKVYCPFQLVYTKYVVSTDDPTVVYLGNINPKESQDDQHFIFYLDRYQSFHNHDLDLPLIKSELHLKVPELTKAGKFRQVPREVKVLIQALSLSAESIHQPFHGQDTFMKKLNSNLYQFVSDINGDRDDRALVIEPQGCDHLNKSAQQLENECKFLRTTALQCYNAFLKDTVLNIKSGELNIAHLHLSKKRKIDPAKREALMQNWSDSAKILNKKKRDNKFARKMWKKMTQKIEDFVKSDDEQ